MSIIVYPSLAFAVALLAGWAITVPVHRFKELRPKSPRDFDAEVGANGAAPQVVRAAYRHALCPGCHREQHPRDVIPVVSWFRGCPGCRRRPPLTVAALQVGMALAAAVTTLSLSQFTHGWAMAIPFVWLVVVLGAVSVIDLRIWLIPYWLPWLGAAVGLVLISITSIAIGRPHTILYALGGATALFVLFFALWLVAPAKLGFSDVRLAALIGLFLGWINPILPIYGLLFGSVLAVAVGLFSIISRRGSRFAFGPSLAIGTLCAVWLAVPILG